MVTVYVTVPRDSADGMARRLVEERLAACVNVVECDSVYRWEGDVHEDEEAILLAKTTEAAVESLEARIEAIHPYEVPCIERFSEDVPHPAFAEWRADATIESGKEF